MDGCNPSLLSTFNVQLSTKKDGHWSSFLWGRVDSNHRTHPRTDLQSVAIAAMRLPQGFLRCKITNNSATNNIFY